MADLDGVGVRELLDDHEETGLVLDDGVADERLVVEDDGPDVTQRELLAGARLRPLDGDLREVVRRVDREDVLDAESLVAGIDEAAGPRRRRVEERQR